MILKKLTITILFMCIGVSVSAQELSNKQKLREKNKVENFSPKEKDSMQMWFHNETKKLGLSPDTLEKYNGILTDNVFKIRRLNDKDQKNTSAEVAKKFDALVEKTNAQVKPLLTEEQYKMHLKNFGALADAARKKRMPQ